MPANAGIQNILKILDPGVRRDDRKRELQIFYQTVVLVMHIKEGLPYETR